MLQPFGDLGVSIIGLVEIHTRIAATVCRIEIDFVVALDLVFEKDRQFANIDMPGVALAMA
jgi:hypothetical protein